MDSAVITTLQNDPTLQGLLPDGVFWDSAPQGAERFATVTLLDHEDIYMFEGKKAFEIFEYIVKCVIFSTSGSDARKAATQIDALLVNRALTPAGYRSVRCQRLNYRRYNEPDENPDERWQHDGGQYEIAAVPTTE